MGTLQHPANQVERLALVAAAQLGGLNVLQLMNNPMAVALNYGMFRRRWPVRREKVLHLQKLLPQKMESLFLLKKNQNLKLTVPRSQKWGRRRENLLTLKSMLSCDNT